MMSSNIDLLPLQDKVLVLGAQCAHPEDRHLNRAEIKPVQLIANGKITPIPFFDAWGRVGVSSLTWHPERPLIWYITTGNDLIRLDLVQQQTRELDVPNLRDVHELTCIGDVLWIANTAMNEVIAFDLGEERVVKRQSLLPFAEQVEIKSDNRHKRVEIVERFHCNQVFVDYSGEYYCLVHHVKGKQSIRRTPNQVLKKQGNGGILKLATGEKHLLNLVGPHHVYRIDGCYWVFDSGKAAVNIYDECWHLRDVVPTLGWGRGAALSGVSGLFYAGISPLRKRYFGLVQGGRQGECYVEVFDTRQRKSLGSVRLSHIEQVNNLYLLSDRQVEELLTF